MLRNWLDLKVMYLARRKVSLRALLTGMKEKAKAAAARNSKASNDKLHGKEANWGIDFFRIA